MELGPKWCCAVILTWFLAAEPAHGYSTFSTAPIQTNLTTQYPPKPTNGRFQGDLTGSYHVALETDGHPSLFPFPVGNATSVSSNLTRSSLNSPSTSDIGTPTAKITTAPSSNSLSQFPPFFNSSRGFSGTNLATSLGFGASNSTTTQLKSYPSTMVPRPSSTQSSLTNGNFTMYDQNVFVPLPAAPIPAAIKPRSDYPVPRLGIVNATGPVETNKFYAGFFLGSQQTPTFTQPYSVSWSAGGGVVQSFGMTISHIDFDQLAYGPTDSRIPGDPVQFYLNPIGLQSLILSANEFGNSTVLTTHSPRPFSAHIVLQPRANSPQKITFPVVQGMGFITGIYSNLQLLIQSGIFFRSMESAASPRPGIFKYRVTLNDGKSWLIYVAPENGIDPNMTLISNSALSGPAGFSGIVQIAKNPLGFHGENFYDLSCGIYPVDATVTGAVSSTTGTYSLSWTKAGKDINNTPLLMFALPHHIHSFDSATRSGTINLQLRTTTKGNATAVLGERWTMTEPDLPTDMGFAPWSLSTGHSQSISAAAQQFVLSVAPVELQQNMTAQTDLNSMYFSGKALSKFATLVYTVSVLANDPALAAPALERLKACFARFVNNEQIFPLVYDTVWKGAVSSAGYPPGSPLADFGNTYYNDHHFHYGYFILTASIIGALDPSWLTETNVNWVNMLVRDAGNADTNDPMFPFSRCFDWYNGHSWAKGLFESWDGKDEESTSEDVMFSYALKMWGQTLGDASMEARGNLMLGIMRRTLEDYFLMESNNVNQPPNFIANKVTGILFENKVDHTTYFGNELAYIQGIHMLPILPASAYTRNPTFVAQEWDAMFAPNASDPANTVAGGWRGILFANFALIDPASSWNFFAQTNFNYGWIDGGASRTWYLAYAAALGGV